MTRPDPAHGDLLDDARGDPQKKKKTRRGSRRSAGRSSASGVPTRSARTRRRPNLRDQRLVKSSTSLVQLTERHDRRTRRLHA